MKIKKKLKLSLVCTLFLGAGAINQTINLANETPHVERVEMKRSQEQKEPAFDFGKWFQENITPEVITNVITWIMYAFSFFKTLKIITLYKKEGKTNVESINQFIDNSTKELFVNLKKEFNNKLIVPLMAKIDSMQEVIDRLVKAMILSVEKTPESRLALLQLFDDYKNKTKLIDEVQAQIQKEIDDKAKDKSAKVEILTNIEQENKITEEIKTKPMI